MSIVNARRRRGAHARRGRAARSGGRRHRFRWDGRTEAGRGRAGRRVPPPGRPAPPGPHGDLRRASSSSTRCRPGPSCATCRRTRSRRTGRAAPTARRCGSPARPGARGCSSTGPTCRRPRLVATRAIPRGESTAALGRPRERAARPRAAGVVPAGGASPGRGRERRAARASRRAARAVRGHPGLRGALRRRACRPRRSPGRARAPRSRVSADGRRYRWSVRRLGAQPGARSRRPARSERSRCAARLGRSGVAMLTRARGTRTATRRRSRCRAGGARGCSSCCRTPPGRRATGSRSNGDGYPDLLPEDAAVTAAAPVRAATACRRASPATSRALLRFLDRERLALRPHDRPRARRAAMRRGSTATRGSCIAGPPRFSPIRTQQRLRRVRARRAAALAWVGPRRLRLERAMSLGRSLLRGRRTTVARAVRRAPAVRARGGAGRGPERPDRLLPRRAGLVRAVRAARGVAAPAAGARDCSPRPGPASRGRRSSSTARAGGVVARVGIDGFGRALAHLARRRADNAQAMGPALAVGERGAEARDRAGRRWRRRPRCVDRDAAPPRASGWRCALVLAAVILVGHIADTEQFRSLTDDARSVRRAVRRRRC